MKRNGVKSRYIALLSVLILALLCAVLSLGGRATAYAEGGKFDESVYQKVGVTTDQNALPDFLKLDAGAPAIAEQRMKEAYKTMTEGGFDMGMIWTQEYNGGIREWQGFAVQEFRNGDHTADLYGRVHGYIICGTVADGIGAGCLVNDLLLRWVENVGTWGYPIGNQFSVTGTQYLYQNFINGYARLNTSNKTATFKEGKFLHEDGTESASPIAAVETGLVSGTMPAWAIGKEAQIKQAFVAAEQKIKTTDILQEGGFDLGVAFEPVTLWMPENLALTQPFAGGDNSGNPYGWGTQGRLMLSDADGVVFPLVGASLTRWASLNGFRVVGYPLSYPFVLDGYTYQVFSKAYFMTDELGYIENVQLYAGAVSYADKMTLTAETGMAVAQSNFMATYKNYNNTGANLGIPDDYMKWSGGVFTQPFTSPTGTKNYLVQNGAKGSCITVTGAAASVFGQRGIQTTGAPLGHAFTVDGKTVQNFAKGYVNGDGNWVAGKNLLPDGTEASASTVAIHDDTGVLAEGVTEFSASVKDEFIAKVRELNESGTYCYEPVGKVSVVKGCAVQEYKNTSSSAKGGLVLIKATVSAPVRVITDAFYTLYQERGGLGGTMEPPVGDRFCIGGKVYQNFRTGYATVDSANKVSFTEGQNVSVSGAFLDILTGEEIDPVPQDVGVFGDINRIPIELRDKQQEVRAAFVAEYARLMKMGFYPGETDEELVHQWAPQMSYTWINQTFKNGDSTAAAFNNNSALKIFLTDLDKGAFSVYSEMLEAWVSLGSINTVGYPEGNQFVYNGDLYQNFTGGYIRCPNGMSTSAEFVYDKTFEIPAPQKKKGCGSALSGTGALGIALACMLAAGIVLRKRKEVK